MCYIFRCNDEIRSLFVIYHYSSVAVACAKLWYDLTEMCDIRASEQLFVRLDYELMSSLWNGPMITPQLFMVTYRTSSLYSVRSIIATKQWSNTAACLSKPMLLSPCIYIYICVCVCVCVCMCVCVYIYVCVCLYHLVNICPHNLFPWISDEFDTSCQNSFKRQRKFCRRYNSF